MPVQFLTVIKLNIFTGNKIEPAIYNAAVTGIIESEYVFRLSFSSYLIQGAQYTLLCGIFVEKRNNLDLLEKTSALLLDQLGERRRIPMEVLGGTGFGWNNIERVLREHFSGNSEARENREIA